MQAGDLRETPVVIVYFHSAAALGPARPVCMAVLVTAQHGASKVESRTVCCVLCTCMHSIDLSSSRLEKLQPGLLDSNSEDHYTLCILTCDLLAHEGALPDTNNDSLRSAP